MSEATRGRASGPVPFGAKAPPRPPLDLGPSSVFEAVTREMVEHLAADLKEIKTRLDSVLWLLGGTILVDVVLRLAGT